jgi:HEAT repeat protein
VANTEAIDRTLDQLFEAERTLRKLHDELVALPQDRLLEVLGRALPAALREAREDEASIRLVRLAALFGELTGPRAVDGLVDILASEHADARHAAGEQLEALAFDRFREVAEGVERALKRLPVGSPALSELPYLLAEVPEPGVAKLLGRFLAHEDADAVAAAIEAVVEVGDPAAARLVAPLVDDDRTVELAEEGEEPEEVTIGELAAEALELLGGDDDDEPKGG